MLNLPLVVKGDIEVMSSVDLALLYASSYVITMDMQCVTSS